MFNPWAQIIMLILAAAGMGLAYLEAGQRPGWWLHGLKLYVVPVCLWAMIGAAEFSWVPYPAGCISSKCQMAAGPARLMMLYFRMGGVLAAGLLYLIGVAVIRHYWNRIVAWDINRLRNRVDLNKWHLDPETGEFYEITAKHEGAFSFLAVPWATRKMQEYEVIRQRLAFSIMSLVSWVTLFILLVVAGGSGDIFWTAGLWFLLFVSCVLTITAFLCSIAVRFAIKRTGPARLARREDTSVEDQRVHDTGGLMDDDELDAALKGKVRTSKPIRSQPRRA